jgi:hypothetical protein
MSLHPRKFREASEAGADGAVSKFENDFAL